LAIYHFRITSVGRSAGRRATAAAAYRAGERLRDERSGRLYNFAHRKDVAHSEIFLPSHLAGAADAWARSREKLWNTAERAEKRANSRVAREYEVSLPHELSTAQQVALARALSVELAERYHVAVDLAVHLPRQGGDPRNFHAHLLTTTREVTPTGLGAKTGLDMASDARRRRDLPASREEFLALRERWASLTNEALREANVDARVDHRSLAAQGVDREPRPWIPTASLKMEQRGLRSEVADRIRERYRQRVQERLGRAAHAATTPERSSHDSERGAASQALSPGERVAPLEDVDDIRRRAREEWLQLRADGGQKSATESREAEQQKHLEPASAGRGIDDDLSL
jgi:ATP-dependent exoDNAse (exonuclease V) alpha subunit